MGERTVDCYVLLAVHLTTFTPSSVVKQSGPTAVLRGKVRSRSYVCVLCCPSPATELSRQETDFLSWQTCNLHFGDDKENSAAARGGKEEPAAAPGHFDT